jgi:peptidylprolyl isomerase
LDFIARELGLGGRRKLVIPLDMAYGNRGAGKVVKPGETLTFICDLVTA